MTGVMLASASLFISVSSWAWVSVTIFSIRSGFWSKLAVHYFVERVRA